MRTHLPTTVQNSLGLSHNSSSPPFGQAIYWFALFRWLVVSFDRPLRQAWAGGCLLSVVFLLISSSSWGQRFGPQPTFSVGDSPGWVVNRDVKAGIIAANRTNLDNTVSVRLGTDTGSFGAQTVSEPLADGPVCDNLTTKTTANGLGNNFIRGVYAMGNMVYAATDGGLGISTDGGGSFTNRTTANGLGSGIVRGVYAVGNMVYAATQLGVSISADGGNSFTNKNTTNGLGGTTVFGVYAVGSTVYAGTTGGLSISTDGGGSFTNKTTANGLGSNTVYWVYAVGNVVYAATTGGLGISTDGGNSFTNKTTANGLGFNTVSGVYALGNVVYAATNGGLSISTDGGSSFTNKTTANGLGSNTVIGVYVVGGRIYAATFGGGLSFCPPTPLVLSSFTASPATLLTTASTSLSAAVTGGAGPYSYVFLGPGVITPTGNTASVSGLSAGVQTFTVTATDATAPTNQTVTGTLSVTVSEPVPDLIPLLYVTPSLAYSTTAGSVVVDVFEINSAPTSGTITVHISKSSLLSLSFDPAATSLGGKPVQNNVWTFDATSNTDAYILTSSQVIGAGGKLSVGLSSLLTPGQTKGSVSVSATLVGSSGGEVTTTNNADADKMEYFNK